ncbi:hypothetical protein CHS0354_024952 [Potamilus streckersoni]|uniref:DBB domain-containing protein n=1 Tax=Potamilus streckersoni TaxID=2493646 RepID=A0AAE0W032_9BIVA|nr:hypothetical protein CHS0354_024952 [Potamilus streckersoni]
MSEDVVHSIFHQFDGEHCAQLIKDFFSRRRYNVQFNLHKLQIVNAAVVSNTGVSILLLTPKSYDFIQSQKKFDLNAIFPNPEFSVVLLYQVENTKAEITRLLSSRIRNFHKWTILEYQVGSSLYALGIDIMEIVERSEGWTPAPPLQKFWVWMREGVKSHKQLLLMFTNPVNDDSNIKVIQGWDGLKVMAERLNPVTYSFTIGDVEPGERMIEVYVNDISFGKAVLHVEPQIQELSHLLHSVMNPVELLCQCLRIVPSTRENLDRGLRDLLFNHTSLVSHIFDKLNWERFGDSDSIYELPTLLHFGAKYGLKLFCVKLLSLPGGKHALKIKNKDGLLPEQIARKEGFDDMVTVLQNSKKEAIYLENPISPLAVKPKDPDNIFKFGPQILRPCSNNSSNIPRNGSRSSPSQVHLPTRLPRKPDNTKSVCSSSDSGISEEVDATESKI